MIKSTESFRLAFAAIHMAQELAEKMSGDDGGATKFKSDDVHQLKRLTRDAAAAANQMDATYDGQEHG